MNESILNELIEEILSLVKEYRKNCKDDLWISKSSEEYGVNEFIKGKLDAYEECVQLLKEYKSYSLEESI